MNTGKYLNMVSIGFSQHNMETCKCVPYILPFKKNPHNEGRLPAIYGKIHAALFHATSLEVF